MITRRRILALPCALAASGLRAQQQTAIHYREYARCLPDYLSALAGDAYERRNARIARLNSPAEIRGYQDWARRTFRQIVGGLPERTPLDVRTVGGFERPAYRVEKIVYESRPGFFVAANLYLPKTGSAPYPGVLFQMGHSNNGKSYALYQRGCQGLVQLGYVVLAFDPIGQGERTNYPRPGGWLTRLRSPTEEHTMVGKQMLLAGETATGAMLWDAMRSLDVLAAQPQVDAQRLASTGQSGGGTLTMILAGLETRLAAAVCSGNTENFAVSPFLAPGSADDAEQDLIGSGPVAYDRWDMLWPLAPKPLLVAVSAHDFFGTYSPAYARSGREEFGKLSHAYSILGAADRLQHFASPLPHALSYPMRLAVYNFFERFLKHSDRTIEDEPPTDPEKDETLWCGKTGNVIRDFASKPAATLVRERARAIRTPGGKPDLRALLGMDAPVAEARLAVCGATRYRNCEVQAVEVASAKQVWVPAWLFLPKKQWSRMLLVIDANGRNNSWHEGDLCDQLASAGIAVCAADVRGVGDLQAEFSPGAIGYARSHQTEENYAWASLILGHSLLGQRTVDIAALAAALAHAYPRASIALAARGNSTVPALCAAAIEPRIAKTYLARHLVSWRSIAEAETYSCPLAELVPDALRVTDLPEIARSIAPRAVIVAGAVDANGRLLPRGGAPYADYREEPAWDSDALSRI